MRLDTGARLLLLGLLWAFLAAGAALVRTEVRW
jgi:hypothetical protein